MDLLLKLCKTVKTKTNLVFSIMSIFAGYHLQTIP